GIARIDLGHDVVHERVDLGFERAGVPRGGAGGLHEVLLRLPHAALRRVDPAVELGLHLGGAGRVHGETLALGLVVTAEQARGLAVRALDLRCRTLRCGRLRPGPGRTEQERGARQHDRSNYRVSLHHPCIPPAWFGGLLSVVLSFRRWPRRRCSPALAGTSRRKMLWYRRRAARGQSYMPCIY